jgi:hypothetical protein
MRQVGSVFGIAVLGNLVTRRFIDQMSAAVRALHLPGPISNAIMTMAKEGRGAAPARMPPGIDAAAIQHTVGSAFAAGFTSGLHLALWVSGIMLLVGAPIALATIRGTAPHHVAAREAVARKADAAAAAGSAAAAEAVEAKP